MVVGVGITVLDRNHLVRRCAVVAVHRKRHGRHLNNNAQSDFQPSSLSLSASRAIHSSLGERCDPIPPIATRRHDHFPRSGSQPPNPLRTPSPPLQPHPPRQTKNSPVRTTLVNNPGRLTASRHLLPTTSPHRLRHRRPAPPRRQAQAAPAGGGARSSDEDRLLLAAPEGGIAALQSPSRMHSRSDSE